MKPTLEQLQEWRSQAIEYAHGITNQYPSWKDAVDLKFAELAAQWGASQAQQTTEPEAWSIPEWSKQDDLGGRVPSDVRVALNEAHRAGVRVGMAQQTTNPLGFQIRRAIAAEDELRATKQTLEHAYAALQKVADAQAAIEEPELPEPAYLYDEADEIFYRPSKAPTDVPLLHLYTTTQMHDHFQAGVRAGAAQMEARKDAAYLERNRVVAALAKCFPSGTAQTAIEGWSEDWHGCVYIDLPTGQVSWHFHDSQAYLFDDLPPYTKQWDGHNTEEKYQRVAALREDAAESRDGKRLDWLAMYGTFSVDSVTGLPGGDRQMRIAATRNAIDAAMKEQT